MGAHNFRDLKAHAGHNIVCVIYGNDHNVAIECEDCNEVLLDYDKDEEYFDQRIAITTVSKMLYEFYDEDVDTVAEAIRVAREKGEPYFTFVDSEGEDYCLFFSNIESIVTTS